MATISCDALVVGAGFAGIYQLKRLVDQNLAVVLIDAASDVGGTWLWNRYPGAASDTESYLYRYSWDKEDLLQCPWEEHYVTQPEVLSYLKHVVDRYDLRRHMRLNIEMTSATFEETSNIWKVQTSKDTVFTTRYLVTGLGLLSKQNFPDIPGLKERAFNGELYHTGNWPKSHDFTGKRVAVIGNGSTGVQLITAIAPEVAQLTCFQRSPQYSVPNGNGPVSRDYREMINRDYDQIWSQVKTSAVAFGFEESKTPAMSVGKEERERKFQAAWDKGNGFRFMFWTFCDITYDVDANEAACGFIRQKIAEIVYDPEKARKLTPTEPYARRPLCDGGYYQQFNQHHVDIVELKKTPIAMIIPEGIKTSDGTVREFDVIVFATGFDAVDGNYTRLEIKGRGSRSLKDHWTRKGPVSYLGMCVAGFPNLFMVTGPNGPFTNIPPTIETQVDFISDIIGCCEARRQESSRTRNVNGSLVTSWYGPFTHRANGTIRSGSDPDALGASALIEVKPGAEDAWTDECERLCENSLFKKTDSWIFGANVPGKKNAVRFYFGGLGNYRAKLKDVREDGYRGFKLF